MVNDIYGLSSLLKDKLDDMYLPRLLLTTLHNIFVNGLRVERCSWDETHQKWLGSAIERGGLCEELCVLHKSPMTPILQLVRVQFDLISDTKHDQGTVRRL